MRVFVIIVAVIFALLIAAGAGILWLLQDPNRYKSDIEAIIRDATGFEVALKGDLSWRLWPPVILQAEDLAFENNETRYSLERLSVDASARALLSGTPELKVQSLRLAGLTMSDKRFESVTQIDVLTLADFSIGQPSPLHIEGVSAATSEAPTPFELDAIITYDDAADSLTLQDATFDAAGATGVCQGRIDALSRSPSSDHQEGPDDLLPIDTFRAQDFDFDCTIPSYTAADLTLEDIAVDVTNRGGLADIEVRVPEFFDGTATIAVDINASRHDPRWKVTPDIAGANTQSVMDWLQQGLSWQAPLLFGGEFTMVGNTTEELLGSINGGARFDGGQGRMDISAIKRNAATLAQLAGSAGALGIAELPQLASTADKVAAWPDELDYSKLVGDWQIDGKRQSMSFSLDNLDISADGTVDTLTDELDMAAKLTFQNDPTLHSFDIPDALRGVPIPVRCIGSVSTPDCGLDRNAAQRLIGEVVRKNAGSKLESLVGDKLGDDAKKALRGLGSLFGGKKDDN
ncbi:MAG: AsmA family protein [Pseudomonadota bacterium]